MRFHSFQEKFHTILIITNKAENENTNECIGKLMAILTFRAHINVKSLFYLLKDASTAL